MPFVRFGRFAFDPAAGELWKDRRRVRLPEQPRLILVLLMQRGGELVTREELRQSLWPADTFVDYEHGLNVAIKRLRDALGDSAEQPRFIETVPRRGYRFIGAIDPAPDVPATAPPEPAAPFWTRSRALGVTAILIAVGGAVAVLMQPRSIPAAAGEHPQPPPTRLTQVTFDGGLTIQPALSPDGRVLVYASDRAGAGDLDIWSQRDGDPPIRLSADPVDEREPSFSPDGSRIVFRSERDGGGIYVMPAYSGGHPRRLAAGGHNPRFSPDGRFVAYWTGGPDTDHCHDLTGMNRVFIVPAEGGAPRQIVPQFLATCWPVWAPDSRHLLVTVQTAPDAPLAWFVAPIDGGPPVDTGSSLEQRYQFAHLPRQEVWLGTRIIFSVWRLSPRNLWATRIDPSTWQVSDVAEQLTIATEEQTWASASRTGKLAYSARAHKLPLWSLPLDAERGSVRGGPERLTDGLEYDRYPTISSDGTSICFARAGPKGQAVLVRNAHTGRERVLVAADEGVGLPVISPDGTRVAYDYYGDSATVEVIPTNGGASERVVSGCRCAVSGWSHDNRRLLYGHDNGQRGVALRDVDLQTGRVRVVASAPDHMLSDASYSSDDRWVLFLDILGDGSRVVIAPSEGDVRNGTASWIPITTADAWHDSPTWSPDGSLVYFISERDGFRCIWARRIDPRSRRPIQEPFAIHHAHGASVSLRNALAVNLNLAVARDRLVFNAGVDTGNIWSLQLDAAR